MKLISLKHLGRNDFMGGNIMQRLPVGDLRKIFHDIFVKLSRAQRVFLRAEVLGLPESDGVFSADEAEVLFALRERLCLEEEMAAEKQGGGCQK